MRSRLDLELAKLAEGNGQQFQHAGFKHLRCKALRGFKLDCTPSDRMNTDLGVAEIPELGLNQVKNMYAVFGGPQGYAGATK